MPQSDSSKSRDRASTSNNTYKSIAREVSRNADYVAIVARELVGFSPHNVGVKCVLSDAEAELVRAYFRGRAGR
jgi:hypothetical protein